MVASSPTLALGMRMTDRFAGHMGVACQGYRAGGFCDRMACVSTGYSLAPFPTVNATCSHYSRV